LVWRRGVRGVSEQTYSAVVVCWRLKVMPYRPLERRCPLAPYISRRNSIDMESFSHQVA
jgi:hypothetical protein